MSMHQQAPAWLPNTIDRQTDQVLDRLMLLHPKVIDLSLGRIKRLLAALNHPEHHLPPVIHIAGTNAKGSVHAYLAAALQAAGKVVHAYTSPHLVRFSERIRLGGPQGMRAIAEPALIELLEECEAANAGQPITFFEITTAAAFLAFSRIKADYLLLETGLGGRLDATNVVDQPALTIITPISIDHQSFLGEKVAMIAGEKAGILKPGIAAIIGAQPDDARAVIEATAAQISAPLTLFGQDYESYEQHGRLVYQDSHGLLDLPRPRLMGHHQFANAGIAIAALRRLDAEGMTERHIGQGLETAEWPARLERLGPGKFSEWLTPGAELWLDGGHNEAAGVAIAAAMADFEEHCARPLHLIVGMMEGKDPKTFLAPFAGLATRIIAVPVPDQENGLPAEQVASAAAAAGLRAAVAADLPGALRRIRRETETAVRILITGSLYLAGHVLSEHRGFALKAAP